jgi:ABC-2 type transport system permease protein
MRWSKAWMVASKDFKIFFRKKSILYSMVGFEVLVAIGLPILVRYVVERAGNATAILPALINAFSFWFVIGIVILPTGIASYSLVGEKLQKSLEPLLATPTTDEEILAGKVIAAFVPAVVANYIGAVIFMLLVNAFTFRVFSVYYFPNWDIAIQLLLLGPLACLLSIGYNVLVSSRSTDVRAAQQAGSLITLPYGAVYVLTEIGVLALSTTNLLIMSAILAALDVIIFSLVKATFRREAILTEWK